MIPQKRVDIDRIKREHPIEDYLIKRGYNVKRHGAGYICRCPLDGHDDKHPSFTIRGYRWTCWSHPGGVVHGTIIDLIMLRMGETFIESVERLNGRNGPLL